MSDEFAGVNCVADGDLGSLPASEFACRKSCRMAVGLVKCKGFLFDDVLARECLIVFLFGSLVVRDPLCPPDMGSGLLRFLATGSSQSGRSGALQEPRA